MTVRSQGTLQKRIYSKLRVNLQTQSAINMEKSNCSVRVRIMLRSRSPCINRPYVEWQKGSFMKIYNISKVVFTRFLTTSWNLWTVYITRNECRGKLCCYVNNTLLCFCFYLFLSILFFVLRFIRFNFLFYKLCLSSRIITCVTDVLSINFLYL